MNRYRSINRIALTATLLLAATAVTSHCAAWDPFGIQDTHEYMPFGQYGPKLTIGTPSPTKIRNGGKFGQQKFNQQNRVAQRATPARTIRFDDLNLAVTTPTGPWVQLDPQKTSSRARLLLTRTNPTMMISLAGEAVGVEPREPGTKGEDTNASLLAASQAKMRSLPGAMIEPGERELTAGGIPGLAFSATVADGQSKAYYTIWVAAHQGFTYKLAVYGDYLHKRLIDEAMQNFLTDLKQIQPNRVARAGGNQKAVAR